MSSNVLFLLLCSFIYITWARTAEDQEARKNLHRRAIRSRHLGHPCEAHLIGSDTPHGDYTATWRGPAIRKYSEFFFFFLPGGPMRGRHVNTAYRLPPPVWSRQAGPKPELTWRRGVARRVCRGPGAVASRPPRGAYSAASGKTTQRFNHRIISSAKLITVQYLVLQGVLPPSTNIIRSIV